MTLFIILQLFFSFFKTLVGKEIAVELKNDVVLTGTLHSVDQYLNIKEAVCELAEDLPVGVDLVNLDRAPEWFLGAIDYVPQHLYGNESRYHYVLGLLDGIRKNNSR